METQTPSQQYDFISQSGQPAKKRRGLMRFPKIAAIAVVLLILVIGAVVGGTLISSKKKDSQQAYLSALARGQEIIRVSGNVSNLAQDAQTDNLSSTVQNTLTSEQKQLKTYLTAQKIVIKSTELNVDQNSGTDSQMQTASTNGTLDNTYASYVKSALASYQTDLQKAYTNAGPHGKEILSDANKSVEVILQSSQVANAN